MVPAAEILTWGTFCDESSFDTKSPDGSVLEERVRKVFLYYCSIAQWSVRYCGIIQNPHRPLCGSSVWITQGKLRPNTIIIVLLNQMIWLLLSYTPGDIFLRKLLPVLCLAYSDYFKWNYVFFSCWYPCYSLLVGMRTRKFDKQTTSLIAKAIVTDEATETWFWFNFPVPHPVNISCRFKISV